MSLTDNFARWCTDDQSVLCTGGAWYDKYYCIYLVPYWSILGKLSKVTKYQGLV